MKCVIIVCLALAAGYASAQSDPYNQEEGKCGCCPLPCCCVCVEETEEVPGPTTPPQTTSIQDPVCVSPLNLAFVVDHSSSIKNQNLPMVKTFLRNFIQQMAANEDTKTAMVIYSTNGTVLWNFGDDEATDIGLAHDKINTIELDFTTNLPEGIALLLDDVFSLSSFDSSVPTLVLVISDGRNVRFKRTLPGLIERLHNVPNVVVAALGVTEKINSTELNMVSTVGTHFFAEDFDDLVVIVNELIVTICEDVVIPTTPAPVTVPPRVVVVGEECFCCCPSPYMTPYGAKYYY